ncbi:MAG: hypothetical protein IPK93_00105 [Solirubrobacterales bacterium]|nr:hypothetical protein [Solirubrobacterales bacterium]
MTFSDVIEASLSVVLFVFVALCIFSLIPMLVKWRKGRPWGELIPHPGRFISFRLGIAAGLGAALFVIVAAALTLNQHRPPQGESPVIAVSGSTGRTAIDLSIKDCGDPALGTIRVSGLQSGSSMATIQSERDLSRPIALNRNGVGHFTLREPSSKRSLLSCFMQLPVVEGGAGSSASLTLGNDMQVDTVNSIPAPSGYLNGRWVWNCQPGETCGVVAAAGLDVEDGAQQIIVLILASVFGAIIALFIGKLVIEPARRRLDRLKKD